MKYLKFGLLMGALLSISILTIYLVARNMDKCQTQLPRSSHIVLHAPGIPDFAYRLNTDECIEIGSLVEYCKGKTIIDMGGDEAAMAIVFDDGTILFAAYRVSDAKLVGKFEYIDDLIRK